MLKIKDNVDLKKLEKFGFEEDGILDGKVIGLTNGHVDIELYDSINDKWNTRKIYVLGSAYLDTIYDLIKADLVEKVEELGWK